MCGICGCSQTDNTTNLKPIVGHHRFVLRHDHSHEQVNSERLIKVERDLLSKNNAYAAQNREYFERHGIFVMNLVSSPGAGKTSLLVETIKYLKDRLPIAVIEGDQQTERDAERIRAAGAPAIQVNTGRMCHLDAHAVGHALMDLAAPDNSLLFIENVGNLVCPSAFDLGEAHKVVVLSVTEGDDKPLKYPDIFYAADIMLVNKIDLLPYVDFNLERCKQFARQINPRIKIIKLSAKTGENFLEWTNLLMREPLKIPSL